MISGVSCLVAVVVAVPLVADMDGWHLYASIAVFFIIAVIGFWSTRNNDRKPSKFLPPVFLTVGTSIGIFYLLSSSITPAISALATGVIFSVFSMQESTDNLLGFVKEG